ncbi:hypothetical protein KSP39_PZI017878 [Platanthera zijinensis]|uniref:Uncharacterized protein n=1 Tax=Platanthera zijinensis TaxID=2320716 RepID=A0AAP0B5A5_9ASPA
MERPGRQGPAGDGAGQGGPCHESTTKGNRPGEVSCRGDAAVCQGCAAKGGADYKPAAGASWSRAAGPEPRKKRRELRLLLVATAWTEKGEGDGSGGDAGGGERGRSSGSARALLGQRRERKGSRALLQAWPTTGEEWKEELLYSFWLIPSWEKKEDPMPSCCFFRRPEREVVGAGVGLCCSRRPREGGARARPGLGAAGDGRDRDPMFAN